MKLLHNIQPTLTEQQLASLYVHTREGAFQTHRYNKYSFNGNILIMYVNDRPRKSCDHPSDQADHMRIWLRDGKPMPDLSKLV